MKQLSKWSLALLPFAAALASGCSRERIETPDDAHGVISFGAIVGRQEAKGTRAKEFGYWQASQKLYVEAYETGSADATPWQKFELTYVPPGTTGWVYEPLLEVPAKSLTYFAYHPKTASVSGYTANGSGASFTYTIPDPQEDVVAAMTVTPNARVALMFYHILSQVNFAIQAIQGVKIDVSQIILNDLPNTGTYTFGRTGGTWSALAGVPDLVDYTYQWDPAASGIPTDGSNSNVIYLGNTGGNSPTDNDRTNAMMLLPQTFKPASGTGPYLSFHYTLTDMLDAPLKSGWAKVYMGDFNSAKWEMGKRYLYLLDFTGLMESGPITFEVIAFGWGNANPGPAQPIVVADITKVLIEKAITEHNTNKAATPQFTVFPISLPEDTPLGANVITLKDFDDDNFVAGDQVRIKCWVTADVSHVLLDPTIENITWTRSVEETVVTLTKL